MIRKRSSLLVMVLLLGGAVPGWADPINITSGAVVYSRGNPAQLVAQGHNGWGVNVLFGQDETNYPVSSQCWDNCTAGTVVTLAQSESIVNTRTGDDPSVGGYFFQGGTYSYTDSMSFTIDAANFTLPPTVGQAPMVSPSFVFRGTLTGTSDLGAQASVQLFGMGRTALSIGDNRWFATSYLFEDPAAVPEPGTLLLFATGAAAAIRRRLKSAA